MIGYSVPKYLVDLGRWDDIGFPSSLTVPPAEFRAMCYSLSHSTKGGEWTDSERHGTFRRYLFGMLTS